MGVYDSIFKNIEFYVDKQEDSHFNGNNFKTKEEAQALIDLWDSAEDLKKCVEILKDALKCLRTHYTPENMLKATNAISESEKFYNK